MKTLLKSTILRLMCYAISLFCPLKKRRVFFKSYHGARYACNPRAISEKLHEMAPDYEILWSFTNPDNVPECPAYVRKLKSGTLSECLGMFTSKVCVFNAGIVLPCKRRGQLFLDTWHGDRAFKKVDVSADKKSRLADAYRIMDAVLSGSDYADKVYADAMKFRGEILHYGSPRNDIFFKDNSALVARIREALGVTRFERLVTYAPTFRGERDGLEPLDFSSLIDSLEKRDGKKWGVLIRQHYKVKPQESWKKDERVVDVSAYPEMQDILLVSDVVISDYSSLVGDFALLGRPIVLYVPDLDEYKSGRGLYFDIEKSPFRYAEKPEGLFKEILAMDEASAKKNCKEILDFYGLICEDGMASERVCRWIMDKDR